MTEARPLSAKQLAVIDDLFEGKEDAEILRIHNISRKLYDEWLADEGFNEHLNRRMVWKYRGCELMLAHSARKAVCSLMKMTESEQAETARKACIDIITMRANLLAGTRSSGTPDKSIDTPALSPESQPFSPETAGKILAVLAAEKTISTA
jgi:hypothetical protein